MVMIGSRAGDLKFLAKGYLRSIMTRSTVVCQISCFENNAVEAGEAEQPQLSRAEPSDRTCFVRFLATWQNTKTGYAS